MVKKGRHRRYEEARQLKRSRADDDIEGLMGRLDDDPFAFLDNNSDSDGADAADDDDEGSAYEDPYADEAAYSPESGEEASTSAAHDADDIVDAGSVPEAD
jgi:hypothetical protein